MAERLYDEKWGKERRRAQGKIQRRTLRT